MAIRAAARLSNEHIFQVVQLANKSLVFEHTILVVLLSHFSEVHQLIVLVAKPGYLILVLLEHAASCIISAHHLALLTHLEAIVDVRRQE